MSKRTPVPARVPRSLPRGKSPLPRNIVLLSQRGRIIEATARAVAAKGYAATTVADITRIAGVSRTTFYQQFQDKEDCFLSCYEEEAELHYSMVVEAGQNEADLIKRFQNQQRSYLRALDREPEYARAYFLESLYAGERAMARRREHGQQYITLYQDWFETLRQTRPSLQRPDPVVFELAVIGAGELVADRIRQGQVGSLEQTLLGPLLLLHARLYQLPDLESPAFD